MRQQLSVEYERASSTNERRVRTSVEYDSIEYELVPGVSSALAAPALAGFPLTDKHLGTSTAFLSAHSPDSIR